MRVSQHAPIFPLVMSCCGCIVGESSVLGLGGFARAAARGSEWLAWGQVDVGWVYGMLLRRVGLYCMCTQ